RLCILAFIFPSSPLCLYISSPSRGGKGCRKEDGFKQIAKEPHPKLAAKSPLGNLRSSDATRALRNSSSLEGEDENRAPVFLQGNRSMARIAILLSPLRRANAEDAGRMKTQVK